MIPTSQCRLLPHGEKRKARREQRGFDDERAAESADNQTRYFRKIKSITKVSYDRCWGYFEEFVEDYRSRGLISSFPPAFRSIETILAPTTPSPPLNMLYAFIEHFTTGSKGRIDEAGYVTVSTALSTSTTWFYAYGRRRGVTLDKHDIASARNFIRIEMKDRYDLKDAKNVRAIPDKTGVQGKQPHPTHQVDAT